MTACNKTANQRTDTPPVFDVEELPLIYVQETQAVLGKNLIKALSTKGAAGAVEFCNTRALPLTDSAAGANGVIIRRLSDQPRNPMNEATGMFAKQIANYKSLVAQGNKPLPAYLDVEGKEYHCFPIMMNAMCLKCHGTNEIDTATQSKLNALYPNDKATGYSENQVRGIWVVEGV
jgi:hypothetical protein